MIWSIIQSDALAFFQAQPEGSLDLVFGSPPYESQRLYLEDGEDLGIARDTEEWVAWMVEITHAALRACRGLVAWVVEGQTQDYRYSASPVLLMAELARAGVCLRKPPIYHRVGIPGSGGNRKQHEANGGGADWLRNDYEFVVCATNGGKLPWADGTACGHPPKWAPGGEMSHRVSDGARVNQWGGHARSSQQRRADGSRQPPGRPSHRLGRGMANGVEGTTKGSCAGTPAIANPGNVISLNVGGGQMGHPMAHENEAPFPEDLARFFIRSFCRPGGLVCDPFSGSGTTASVAKQEGRRFAGCDLRPSQVKLGLRRLASITPNLFQEESP